MLAGRVGKRAPASRPPRAPTRIAQTVAQIHRQARLAAAADDNADRNRQTCRAAVRPGFEALQHFVAAKQGNRARLRIEQADASLIDSDLSR